VPAALPVDPYVPAILDVVRRDRAAVVVAAPGAGKTTRVPAALSADGPVILLQPRRIAARSIARRIALEQGWTLGREVGWHVRFDRRFVSDTRLLVATEGILTARLQQDPLLSDFRTIVLDEFHERTIHADLGIALARQAWRARDDLRIVVMSATLDADRVAAFLGECRVFDIAGTLHALEVEHRPGSSIAEATREVLTRTSGQVLCFLPGAGEVRRAARDIRSQIGATADVVELHGSQTAEEQDHALDATSGRRAIVATNIAETSLTVPGVRAVVDGGQHKVARYDADRGVDSLSLERISQDAADQRAGRAARVGPGIVLRLWDARDRLRPHREPDILRMDLSGPLLDLLAWGGDPRTFEWFEPPLPGTLDAAWELLIKLGAIEGTRLTPRGRQMARLALHPRLARILIDARGAREAAIACAILSERQAMPRHPPTTTCDLLADERDLPQHIVRNADEIQRGFAASARVHIDEGELRRVLLAGYPDRVAQRRAAGDRRVLLSSGHGGVLTDDSGVRDGEFVLALDLQAGRRGEASEARVRIASIADKSWIAPTAIERVDVVDRATGALRSFEREMYGAILLRERPVAADREASERALVDVFLSQPLRDADAQLVNRLRFADVVVDLPELAQRAASGRQRVDEIRLEDGLDWTARQRVAESAPSSWKAPSGRTHPLTYTADGGVTLSIKLQELFGLPATPLIGPRRAAVLIHLLAPNGRPVQSTRDLKSFWNTMYQEVRKELRARYPRHPWPEDPWNAIPTARPKGSGGRKGGVRS
jgi:ATP-dependent helicase HrpB